MYKVLTIAGSDSSGGAGIQADLKTMLANGVYGMSVITALTAQNTMEVTDILNSTPEFLAAQLEAVLNDIYPDAVKTGMVASIPLIETIADKLKIYNVKNIVVDPVMVTTTGASLLDKEAIDTFKKNLLPIATVLTPNIPEAEVLAEMSIETEEEMRTAAKLISEEYQCAVLCKGGHRTTDANDVLYNQGLTKWFRAQRINNPNAHGTGDTLASAIASNLAKGLSLETAIQYAKDYLTGALKADLNLGKGAGLLDHGFALHSLYTQTTEFE